MSDLIKIREKKTFFKKKLAHSLFVIEKQFKVAKINFYCFMSFVQLKLFNNSLSFTEEKISTRTNYQLI